MIQISRTEATLVVEQIIEAVQSIGDSLGMQPEVLDSYLERVLEFLASRLTGEYEVDLYGYDREFSETVFLPIARLLYEKWFRVEVRGIENLPKESGALLVANHSGTLPIDGIMMQVAVRDNHPLGREMRVLAADLIFRFPLLGEMARKAGATVASGVDAQSLLTDGHLLGVFPEGYKGVGKPFDQRYQLQRFGRGGFITSAAEAGVPIIPVAVVGAEEIYPKIGDVRLIARLMNLPYFPITPLFPWFGLLGLVPLPSKWIIDFGEPISTEAVQKTGLDDPAAIFDLSDRVRVAIQERLYQLVAERDSVF